MGTVVCLPAGPDLISQCNRCAACLPKAFGKRGKVQDCTLFVVLFVWVKFAISKCLKFFRILMYLSNL